MRYQWLLPVVISRVFSGWTQVDSYRKKGAAVGLNRGFITPTVQLGANCLPGTECQAWNEINAAITADDTGKPNGRNRRAHEGAIGETPGIFIVLSGFATTDLSVRFRDARQGGAYGKTALRPFLLLR